MRHKNMLACINILFLMWRLCEGVQRFIEVPVDTRVILGQTAMLNCSVEDRVGYVQWVKDETLLGFDLSIPGYPRYSIYQPQGHVFNLQILNTSLWDDDMYECQVLPSQGNPYLQASASLTILVPPDIPSIVGHPNGSTVDISHSDSVYQLTCQANNARPAATITWYKNGRKVDDNIQYSKTAGKKGDKRENATSVLTMNSDFVTNEHNSEYKCMVTNEAMRGRQMSQTVTINVLYPPSRPVITGYSRRDVVRAGHSLTLTCKSAGGNPLARVTWYKDNNKIDFSYSSSNDMSINEHTITVLASDNDAVFRCDASNKATPYPLTASVKLVVYFPPRKVTITGNTLAKAGEQLELTCTSSNSNPAANISWYAPGTQLVGTETTVTPSNEGGFITTSKLRVTLTDRLDNVVYTCQALNSELSESASDTVTLSVLYPPGNPVIQGYSAGDFIKAGDQKKLTCSSAGGNPKATVKWFKGFEELTSTTKTRGNIVISEVSITVKASDNGADYKCTASNEATSSPLEKVIKLVVYFPPEYVTVTAEPTIAKAGRPLSLTCVSSSSNPPAAIIWARENVIMHGENVGRNLSTNGGMTTKNVLNVIPTAADHQSEYHCQAKNLKLDDMVNNAITLNVLFKPQFDPAVSPTFIEIKEGEGRTVNLTATANPKDITYKFYKDGAPIYVPGDVYSFSFSQGILTISNVRRGDRGQYMLEAKNNEGTSNFNFTLNVKYPAEITAINPSKTVMEDVGGTAFFECVADANPFTPNMVTWSREKFDMTKTEQTYEKGKGHLTVYQLKKEDTGKFVCTADNGLGTPTTKKALLVVKFAPEIDKTPQYAKAAGDQGSTIHLYCKVKGAPTVTFTWSKDSKPISSSNYQSDDTHDNDKVSHESVLIIRQVSKQDYGKYKCQAVNTKGNDSFVITVDGTSVPDQPFNLQYVNVTHETITFSWDPGFNGGLPQKFQVKYHRENKVGHTVTDVTHIDTKGTTFFTIKGLQWGTKYVIQVLTRNPLGPAEGTPPSITIKTADSAPTSGTSSTLQNKDDTPVIIILVVCVVGVFLLALNIGLILFFVRRRKKRLENNSDTTSHTNTIELYGPTKEMALYPITPSDDSRSYGTYEKNMDDFSDDYKNFEHDLKSMHGSNCNCNHGVKVMVKTISKGNCCISQDSSGDEDIKRVFLPPPGYTSRSYTPNKMDSPQLNSHKTFLTDSHTYLDDPDRQMSQWRYEDPYKARNKGTFDSDYLEQSQKGAGIMYEYDSKPETRPKSVTDYSERSSLSSGRTGSQGVRMTPPPPPPVRSSSKGAAGVYGQVSIPPIPARNYDLDDLPPPMYDDSLQPRYAPPPGSLGHHTPNVITNPHYDGPNASPMHHPHLQVDDMRGDLV